MRIYLYSFEINDEIFGIFAMCEWKKMHRKPHTSHTKIAKHFHENANNLGA